MTTSTGCLNMFWFPHKRRVSPWTWQTRPVVTPSECCQLPCSGSIQVSTILTALNLDTHHNQMGRGDSVVLDSESLSVCKQRYWGPPGILLSFESKKGDNSPIDGWVKIVCWATFVGHFYYTEPKLSPRHIWSPTRSIKDVFSPKINIRIISDG